MSDSNPDSSPLNGVSNNASEELQKEVPQLKFLGLKPLASIQQESKPTPSQKRPLLALSPAGETEEKQELQNTIQEGIKEAIKDIFPSLIDKLKTDLKTTINEIVEEKFQKFVEESKTVWRRVIDERIAELETMLTQTSERMIASKISEMTTDIHRKTDEKLARFITEIGTTTNSEDTVTDLKMLSQTELLETYNRRDNVKVFGLSETIDESGNTETNAQTAQAFLDVTADLNVNVDATDISIAHRLPSRYKNRPIIVKFTRRIRKIEVLKNKRALKTDLKTTINEIVEEKFQKFVEESKTVWRRVIDERIAELETMLTQTSERMIASKISEMTTDIHRKTDEKLARFITEIGTTTNSEDTVTDLKMLSQTELLETYNRRDNVKVFGLSETIDESGNTETNAQTAQAFLDVTADLNVNVDATDISIAHRLPSRYKNRPIIVKFTRRIKKIEVLKNKRALKTDLKTTINEIVEEKFQKFVEESKTVWRRVIDERIAELETMLTQTSERMIASKISEMTTDINRKTDEKLARFITEIGTTTNSEDTVTDLKMLSQTELLETYNRRDNVKVFGLSETIDESGNTETNAQTAQAFLDVTADLNVNVDATDISIAHRLPSRYKNRPIIVKFTRRIKKIEVLKNKRALEESPSFYNVTILEDASKPRLNFLKLMKGDERISSSFIRDGVIHYRWMDGKMYRINNLFEGGWFLNYSLINIQQCFKPPQNPDTERTNQPFRET